MSTTAFVPTRRSIRSAETVYVFEQRNGLWTIIEVHATGTPKCMAYRNQRRSAADACIARALREGQQLIVWASQLSMPPAAVTDADVPLLALEVAGT